MARGEHEKSLQEAREALCSLCGGRQELFRSDKQLHAALALMQLPREPLPGWPMDFIAQHSIT